RHGPARSKRARLTWVWSAAQDGHRASGLLYLAAVRDDLRQQERCQARVDSGLSAWELACHASLTGASQVSCHLRLSASARRVPVLTALSGTQRARSPARHRQLGRSVMAGLTRRAGMYVQVTDVDCPWLAVSDRWSSWHLAAHG